MPVIQRKYNSLNLNNIVYATGNYINPSWITSLSPAKVGSGLAQWNASQIIGYPISSGVVSGEVLYFTGSGWDTMPAPTGGGSGGSGIYFTTSSGIVLAGSVLKMGGTGQLNQLNFEANPSYYGHSGIVVTDSLDGAVNLENTLLGTHSRINVDNFYNVGVGRYSLSYTSGNRNIGIGSNALSFNSSDDCIALGTDSISNNVGFSYSNIGLGTYSLKDSSYIGNMIALGDSSFNSVNIGSHSIALGFYAGALSYNLYNDIFIGDGAGSYSSGSGNVYIGYNAGNSSVGSNNIEILVGSSSSSIGTGSNRLNIASTIYGNLAEKKISIGYAPNFSPSGFFHIFPSGAPAVMIDAPNSNTYNFFTCKANSNTVFSVDSSGSISGNNANFNVISGAISPAIVQSTGMVLSDAHHGKIIEHTGIVNGVYTIGTITVPSWQCTLANFGSGITVASGINTIRSISGYKNISILYSAASVYRRPNGEFFLYGSLN